MLTYNFEDRHGMPLYSYIYACIKEDILRGKIKPHEKLPSKRSMAKNNGISIITVENAYAQLLVEGYIYSEEKKGYYASDLSDGIYVNQSKWGEKLILNKNQESTLKEQQSPAEKKEWVVDLNANHILYDNFPFSTWSKMMRQTLLNHENSFLTAPTNTGVLSLRKAIAQHLKQFRGMEVSPEQIIVGAGTEYLYSLIFQLFRNNCIMAVEDPGYSKIAKIYLSLGAQCEYIPIDKSGMNIVKLHDSKANIAHISPSHHFPTGIITPATRRKELLNWANGEQNRYIIEDDYDSEFRFVGKPIATMASIDREGRVIYMNTFSRVLAPSIRIAYMVLPEKLMKQYKEKLNFYSSTVSSFEQYTLAKFIEKGYYERHLNRMRNYYRDYRNIIINKIKQSELYSKVSIMEEDSGLHFILKINEDISEKEFLQEVRGRGVNLLPLSEYCYQANENFNNQYLINYSGLDGEKLDIALNILWEAINCN